MWASQVASGKNLPANVGVAGDADQIAELGRSPGGGNGNPLQYSCQDNPMDRRARWATVHGVTELDRLSTHSIWGRGQILCCLPLCADFLLIGWW